MIFKTVGSRLGFLLRLHKERSGLHRALQDHLLTNCLPTRAKMAHNTTIEHVNDSDWGVHVHKIIVAPLIIAPDSDGSTGQGENHWTISLHGDLIVTSFGVGKSNVYAREHQ